MTGKKTMYHVEKFLPNECPKCRKKFNKESEDYSRLLGDVINGQKVIRETQGYLIIICKHCDNYTAQYPIETYQLSDKSKAEKLLDEGFVNLIEVEAYGNMAVDRHYVYKDGPRMESIKCEGLVMDGKQMQIEDENGLSGYASPKGPWAL